MPNNNKKKGNNKNGNNKNGNGSLTNALNLTMAMTN
jgi:hypothetical protein